MDRNDGPALRSTLVTCVGVSDKVQRVKKRKAPPPRRTVAASSNQRPKRAAIVVALGLAVLGGGWVLTTSTESTGRQPTVVRSLRVNVHRTFPHDTTAYTQGLIWSEGKLYESTGQYGQSDLRRLDPETGNVEQLVPLGAGFFGEGLARVEDRLIMLTWKAQRAFVFDVDRFDQVDSFQYRGEGWGLCDDGDRLVMSNGSNRLTFRDRHTFDEIRCVDVTLRGTPLYQLNELECVGDAVYANVYTDDFLVRINPSTGRVTEYIDATGLLTAEEARGAAEFNGIAYHPETQRFYVTGKLWPKMFEVTFDG